MSAARAFPGLPADRAGRIAYFTARRIAREEGDDLFPFKVLFQAADPSLVKAYGTTQIRNGRAVGLSTHHEMMRRCFVLRAWAAQKCGWHNDTKIALDQAGTHRRLARAARKEGR